MHNKRDDAAAARDGSWRARLRFVFVFAGIASVLLVAYSFPYAEHGVGEDWFHLYLAQYARLAGAALRLTGADVEVTGSQIFGRVSLTIAKNCDAMDVNIMFAAAVLATPVAWSSRAIGLVVGLTALMLVNVLRIVSLYFVLLHWHSAFEVVHAEVWPLAFVLIVVAAFIASNRTANRTQRSIRTCLSAHGSAGAH